MTEPIERIDITPLGGRRYAVTLHDARATTEHQVRVPPALISELGLGADHGDGERLVRTSFEFLLGREPATAILPSFDLDVIGRYFPEYVATMRQRVGSGSSTPGATSR
jgi:hypothetical protein